MEVVERKKKKMVEEERGQRRGRISGCRTGKRAARACMDRGALILHLRAPSDCQRRAFYFPSAWIYGTSRLGPLISLLNPSPERTKSNQIKEEKLNIKAQLPLPD